MKRLSIIWIVTVSLSCSKQNSDNKLDHTSTLSSGKDSTISTITQADNEGTYFASTYDNPPRDIQQHKASLKELSDSLVFSVIHNKLLATLTKNHQLYFRSKPDYELLYSSTGNLFQNGDDHAFIVFDKEYTRISILVYDALKNKYAELYRDTKVKNGLENIKCHYGSSGTLDYQIGDVVIYQTEYLIKKPESYLEYSKCKIGDITKDENMVLETGCFAQHFSADRKTKSLCISTSSVYNNWECLTYDKTKDEFFIFYGQAFAD